MSGDEPGRGLTGGEKLSRLLLRGELFALGFRVASSERHARLRGRGDAETESHFTPTRPASQRHQVFALELACHPSACIAHPALCRLAARRVVASLERRARTAPQASRRAALRVMAQSLNPCPTR